MDIESLPAETETIAGTLRRLAMRLEDYADQGEDRPEYEAQIIGEAFSIVDRAMKRIRGKHS